MNTLLENVSLIFSITTAVAGGGLAFAKALKAQHWKEIAEEYKELAAARLDKIIDYDKRFKD